MMTCYLCKNCEWHGDDADNRARRAASNAIEEPEPILCCPECGERVQGCYCEYTRADHDADQADVAHASGDLR